MRTDTTNKIVEYLGAKRRATAKELADYLNISRQALFKHLPKLLEKGEIGKIGRPPKVFYFLKEKEKKAEESHLNIDSATKKIIENNFLIITPAGEKKEGLAGFVFWCDKTNQPAQKTAEEYAQTWKKYNALKKGGFIDGTEKIKTTFKKVYLDKLFYLDFYSIERFGKTKLGQMLLYAKQSQNKALIKEIISDIRSRVVQLIKKYNIDGVGFIPPTVKRETQFMKELEKNLRLPTKTLVITKVKTPVIVPQKTLPKLDDRIENAKQTIVVSDSGEYKNIMLIDDAVGSGATLNETAAQIKNRKMCRGNIIGLSITGSFKGFDVISEV